MSKKKREFALRGAQLLARGDIIHVMDKGQLLKCRVLSCLGTEEGSCLASLEILEGDRKTNGSRRYCDQAIRPLTIPSP